LSTDFGLEETGGVYALVDPIEDALERMRNRFTILFLSERCAGRGSTFVSELKAGRVKTNSDVITLFALAATQIISDMRELGEDIYPYRAALNDFTFVSSLTVFLNFTVYTNLGSISDNVVVTAEEE
jgi:hypothetical protein